MLVVYECWWRGDLGRAEVGLQSLRATLKRSAAPTSRLVAGAAEAGLYWSRGEHEACLRVARSVLEEGEELGLRGLDAIVYTFGLSAALSSGDLEEARQLLAGMEARLDLDASIDAYLYFHSRAWLAWIEGDRSTALSNAVMAAELAERAGCPYHLTTAINDHGRLLVLQGEEKAGRALLDRALDLAYETRGLTLRYLVHRSRAVVALHRRDDEACRKELQSAFQIANNQGFRDHTWWCDREMTGLYAFALEQDLETRYVQQMVRLRRLPPPDSAVLPDAWPLPVRIRVFGRVEIEVDSGEGASSRAISGSRPLELLKALALLGGERIRVLTLGELLWPNVDAARVYRSVAVNAQRLRALLGCREAIVLEGERLSLSRHHVWLDLWSLARELKHTASSLDERLRVLALYRDRIAVDEPLSGALLAAREAWHRRYLRAIRTLGASLEAEGRVSDALRLYDDALRIEPLAEFLHQGAVRCLLCQGEHAEAQQAVRRCERVLEAEGLEPTPGLRDLLDERR